MHHQRSDNFIPGDNVCLNTKGPDTCAQEGAAANTVSATEGLDGTVSATEGSDGDDVDDDGDEGLEDIPVEEMSDDPWYLTDVYCGLATGAVVSIARDTVTKEKLYRVLFDDGGVRHFTHEEAHTKLRAYDWCASVGLIDSTE